MQKSGIALHCHHDLLFEFIYDYDERVRFIKENKPANEQELRLKLFQMVPFDRLPRNGLEAYYKAKEAYYKAKEAYYKALAAYINYINAKELAAYDKAKKAYFKALAASVKAREAYFKENKEALDKLHSELCPQCPWDGKTIFPKKAK